MEILITGQKIFFVLFEPEKIFRFFRIFRENRKSKNFGKLSPNIRQHFIAERVKFWIKKPAKFYKIKFILKISSRFARITTNVQKKESKCKILGEKSRFLISKNLQLVKNRAKIMRSPKTLKLYPIFSPTYSFILLRERKKPD